MRTIKNKDLNDRRSAATDAKAALLQAYRSAQEAAGPELAARQAERLAIAAARDARNAERAQLKLEEQRRIEAEKAAEEALRAAEAQAEIEQREAAARDRIALVLAGETARKAVRDQRYANRKARQG